MEVEGRLLGRGHTQRGVRGLNLSFRKGSLVGNETFHTLN